MFVLVGGLSYEDPSQNLSLTNRCRIVSVKCEEALSLYER